MEELKWQAERFFRAQVNTSELFTSRLLLYYAVPPIWYVPFALISCRPDLQMRTIAGLVRSLELMT